MSVIINPKSVADDNPQQIVQMYSCHNHNGEDPEQKILERHLICLTSNQSCNLGFQHNSDKLKCLDSHPGELFIFPTGASHWAEWQNCYALIASIDNAIFNDYANNFLDGKSFNLKSTFKTRDPFIEQLILTLVNVNQNKDVSSNLFHESLCTTLFLRLVEKHSEECPQVSRINGGLSSRNLSQVKEFIDAHCTEVITLEQLAKLIDLSEYHFTRCFKKSVGLTPYQYILDRRLELAKKKLRETRLSIADIALNCGFSSQSHMAMVFKKRFGATPSKIRNS